MRRPHLKNKFTVIPQVIRIGCFSGSSLISVKNVCRSKIESLLIVFRFRVPSRNAEREGWSPAVVSRSKRRNKQSGAGHSGHCHEYDYEYEQEHEQEQETLNPTG